MERKKIVAGNWKMNTTLSEAMFLMDAILKSTNTSSDVVKIIIPPFPYLTSISSKIGEKEHFFLGAQNCHSKSHGAFTGEVSASMLQSVGCQYVLVGHSERRTYFNETTNDFVLKIKEALSSNLIPIFCIGETLEERKANNHFQIITHQLTSVLTQFTNQEFSKFIIAYEPVWAIGTGETATAQQAQEMDHFIRSQIGDVFDSEIATEVPILYGGSCNPKNANELFACKDVDGGLIGGASLKADDFCKIIESF